MNKSSFEALYHKITWRLLPLLLAGYVLSYLDRVNVGFAKLQMLGDLGFSEAVYGFGAAIFFVGYFLFEVPSNIIMHRVGARFWLARIMFTWAILSAACMLINSEWSFYVLRFLLGVAEAGFFPGVLLYITYWFPKERQSSIIGLFMAGIPISGIIGGPISGLIIQNMDGFWGLAGWRWMFVLEAIPTFLLGFVFLKYLPDGPATAPFLNDYERSQVASAVSRNSAQSHSLRGIFKEPRTWKFACLYFCQTVGIYGFTFWLPSLIKETGLTNIQQIGFYTAIPYVCGLISIIMVTRHSDKVGERYWHHSFGVAMAVIGLLMFIGGKAIGSFPVAFTGLCVTAAGVPVLAPLFWPITNAFYSGAGAAGAIGLIASFANIAGFSSPFLIGYVKNVTGSTDYALYAIMAVLIAGTVGLHRTKYWK